MEYLTRLVQGIKFCIKHDAKDQPWILYDGQIEEEWKSPYHYRIMAVYYNLSLIKLVGLELWITNWMRTKLENNIYEYVKSFGYVLFRDRSLVDADLHE